MSGSSRLSHQFHRTLEKSEATKESPFTLVFVGAFFVCICFLLSLVPTTSLPNTAQAQSSISIQSSSSSSASVTSSKSSASSSQKSPTPVTNDSLLDDWFRQLNAPVTTPTPTRPVEPQPNVVKPR